MAYTSAADRLDRVLNAFINGINASDKHTRSDRGDVIDYRTCIATRNAEFDVVIVNDSKYSQQTRAVQQRLKVLLDKNQVRFVTVVFDNRDGNKFGVNANDLRMRYADDIQGMQST